MDFGKMLDGFDGDELARVARAIADHEKLLDSMSQLPDYFLRVADGLEGAGDQARLAALALVGEDGRSGVRGALATSARSLHGLAASAHAGAEKLAEAAAAAAKVPLMDGPAGEMAAAATQLMESTEALGELADGMVKIGEMLATVAQALTQVGQHLGDTGAEARGFATLGKSVSRRALGALLNQRESVGALLNHRG